VQQNEGMTCPYCAAQLRNSGLVGTLALDITEATGIYQSFVGGHNNMVDILHKLADGTFVEHCICIISRPVQPAAIKP
jgi:hypothetical protein